MTQAKWIWKYRDFEKYHAKQYLPAREERGKIVPAFYEIPSPASSVRLPFDKSLCHAWGAGPLYFMGKYPAGVAPSRPGYRTFTVCPNTAIGDFSMTVPIKDGIVELEWKNGTLSASADKPGGILLYKGEEHPLVPGERLCI